MAGLGIALRLHEFRDRQLDSSELDLLSKKAARPGKDVRGLYPGQLGRVHTLQSPNHRVRFASLESPAGSSPKVGQDEYQRSFDLWACQRVDTAQRSGIAPSTTTTVTSYQDHFGTWSSLYVPAENKFALGSHPEPLKHTDGRVTKPASSQTYHQP